MRKRDSKRRWKNRAKLGIPIPAWVFVFGMLTLTKEWVHLDSSEHYVLPPKLPKWINP